MLDPYLLRNELILVSEKLKRKNFFLDINYLKLKEKQRKIFQIKLEKFQSKHNYYSKLIGLEKLKGNDCKDLNEKALLIRNKINFIKKELNNIKDKINNYIITFPNLPSDDVYYGKNNFKDREIYKWGVKPNFDFRCKDHVELGEINGSLDFISGSKLSGSKFVVMKGEIVSLYRALIQFMLDLHVNKNGYVEYYLPYLVNNQSLFGSGHLPKFFCDLFHINITDKRKFSCDYTLIPTAEVPLTNLIRDEILDESILPIKMTSHTPCFRSEAGSYGSDNRGMIRMHQFDKVELFQVVKPNESMNSLEEITEHAEQVLRLLKLPYRKVLLCAENTSFTSCKTYDLEVWLPSKNKYFEISSCSNVSDFQSRRIKARYKSKNSKKLKFVHTLNGSGLAIGRTLIAIMENYQLIDGKIKIPCILKKYMKGKEYIL